MAELLIERRFCGPPGRANGGYAAGLIMRHSLQRLRVRLERAIPLDTRLELHAAAGEALELRRGDEVLARALPAELELEVPPAPSYLEALEASRHFVGFERHSFPTCFVCGPDRTRGDGLRIFAGRVAGFTAGGGELVAAPWMADESLADGAGKVRPEFMCAALDCPGYFAARADGTPMLLGEFGVHIDRCVHIDEPCVIIGWTLRASGRKCEVGTALFGEDGEPCARARGTWIEPRPVPVAM